MVQYVIQINEEENDNKYYAIKIMIKKIDYDFVHLLHLSDKCSATLETIDNVLLSQLKYKDSRSADGAFSISH